MDIFVKTKENVKGTLKRTIFFACGALRVQKCIKTIDLFLVHECPAVKPYATIARLLAEK